MPDKDEHSVVYPSPLDSAMVVDSPLLSTKLSTPCAPSALLSRPRLTAQLTAGEAGSVILLSAPAGFGKTTLAADWVRQQDRPAAWLSLDEHDNDPIVFWRYVIAAVQMVDSRIGHQAQAALAAGSRIPVEAAVTLFINDITAYISPSTVLVLVLDDFHCIHSAPIHLSLNYLLLHQPAQLHLLLLTRADPPLSLARLRVAGRLAELRARELRMTVEETSAFLTERMHLDVSGETLKLLVQQTEGWAAGLRLVALSLRHRGPAGRQELIHALGGAKQHVFSYLMDEVLGHLPDELRRFVQEAAVLDRLCGPLAAAVTGQADAARILRRLSMDNVFVSPLDEEGAWYRFHPLFAEMLRAGLDDATARERHRRAALWFAEQEQMQDAILHAHAAQDCELMAMLLTRSYKDFLAQGLLISLNHWLASLPAACQTPRLRLASAWCRVYGSSEAELQQILDTITPEPSAPTTDSFRGEALAVRAVYASLYGRLDQALSWATEALPLIDPADHLSRAAAYQALGNAYRGLGELDAALAAYAQTRRQFQFMNNPVMGQLPLFRIISIQIVQGRLVQALHTYETIGRHGVSDGDAPDGDAPDGEKPLYISGEIFGHLSELYWEWNDLGRAHVYACKEIQLAQPGHMLFALVDGNLKLANVTAAQGDVTAAQQSLDAAAEMASQLQSAPLLAQVAMCQARHDLGRGDLVAAARWARSYAHQRENGHCALTPLQSQSADLLLARIRLCQGHRTGALRLLEEAIHRCEANGRIRLVAEASVLLSLVLAERGQTAAAHKALIRALALAKQEGYVRVFVEQGSAIAPLLRQVRHLYPDLVARLLSALSLDVTPASPGATLADPLTEREQEILDLIAQGQSNQQIADALFITVGTVKGHVNHILSKLDAQNRTQAVAKAHQLNLLHPQPQS